MANKNPTYVIDIKTRFSDIKKQIKEQQEALIKLQKTSEDLGLGKNISEEIQKAIDELQKMQSEYINTMKEFSKTKLDTSEFTEFSKKVDARLNEVTERVLALEKNITGLSKSFKDVAGIDELNKQFDGLEKRFDNFVNSVKDSINALKEFNTLIGSSSSGNQDDIKKQIKEYEELAHVLETIDFGSKRTTKKSKDFDKLQNEFDDLYDKYTDLMSIIEDEKDPSSIIKMQKEVAELLPKLANVYNAMIKIKDENDLDSSFKPVIRSLTEASSNIQTILESNVAKLKANLKSETEEMQTVTGEMFKFKDGKIQIPVILDEKAISSLKPKYKEIISQLQAYANTNPVDVTMRLFPLNTTKAGQAEVKDAVKNVQAQIADLPEGDLKTSMTDLYNNLEKQYQKALRLKIAVELSEDADAVRKDIEAIKKAVNDDPIEIYPKFIISEKEATALKEKLKKIQDSFSFNVTDSITKMSDSLKVLLESNNTKEWVKNFISGLQEIESELEKVSSSIQPINDLLGTKGKSSKDKSINQNDVNIITAFTDAMTSLRTALDKQGDIKIDIDIQPLIDKLDVIKATVGIVISELGYLQSTLNKIKDDKTVKDSSDFMKNIQESVNKSQPIIIPIEPDLSKINSFIEKIEEAVSGIKVKLNIGNPEEETHTESKLNDILQDKNNANKLYHQMYNGLDANAENIGEPLKKAIAFALVNGLRDGLSSTEEILRVGLKGTEFESIVDQIVGDEESLNNIKTIANNVAESFTSAFNKGSNLESSINEAIKNVQSVLDVNVKNQFDNLNVRVDELQTKINSLWSVWVNNVNNGTNETIEGINRIIAKLGDLAVKLEEVSKKFPGVNFGDTIGDVKNLVYNNGRSDSDIGEIISQMMEADKIMLAAKRQIRERAFYYNLKDGNHSNTYTFDQPTSYGLKNQLLKNDDISKYDAHVHTHPDKYASMSLGMLDKKTKAISGDILAFYSDYLNGIQTQIIAAQNNVEIFDAKKFYDDYGYIFKREKGYDGYKSLVATIEDAKKKIFEDFNSDINNWVSLLNNSSVTTYADIFKGTPNMVGNIFDAVPLMGNNWVHSSDSKSPANQARKILMDRVGIDNWTNGKIIEEFINSITQGGTTDIGQFISDIVKDKIKYNGKSLDELSPEYKANFENYLSSIRAKFKQSIVDNLFQEMYGQNTGEILKTIGINNFDDYVTRMPIEEFRDKYSGIAQVTQEQQTGDTAKESAQNIDKETQAMAELYDKAIAAAEAKSKFVEANKDVFDSIVTSLSALNSEGEGFANLNKLINNLGGKSGDEKLDKTVNGLKQIYEVLNQDISDNALINALNDLASKGTDLENLVTVLKSSKKQITDAKDALNVSNQDKIDSIAKSVDVTGNARGFLSSYGDVVNLTQEVKKGFIEITSTVLGADNVFRRYTLTTKDGLNMNIAKQEEHTTGLEKEILLYQKLLKAAQNLNRVNPNQTDEVFIEEGSDTWNSVVEYAKEYGDNLGNILSITRSVRKVNDELLESFKIIGENGSVTIGAENDVVGSVQNIANITKQYKELLNLRNKLNDTDLKNTQRETYTPEYISRIREMISLIDSAEFDLTNPADVARLEQMVSEAKELDFASKNLDNNLGNMKNLEKLRMKIADILNDFGAMPNKLKEEFGDLKGTVEFFIKAGRISAQQSDELNAKFMELNANLSESGKKYQSLGKQMLERLRSQSSQLLAQYFSFQDLIRYGRTAVTTIIQLDTALVDLRKTTSMNTQELNEFYRASTDIGKQLGVTSQQIIQQAADWSRLGYSTKEQAETMAELSSKFASVSPGMSTDQSTDYLVSTMKAFGIETDEVERKIMDNVNRIGNTFATTNAEIGEMLTRSSAAMHEANNTLEETIALESAAVQITRNAETTGTAFRTVSMRIRGMDEETEELSADLENIAGDLADLTKINGKGGIRIFTDDTRTEYKSTYQILKELADIWDELTDKQHADILEKIAGKRGGQVIAGLLNNFDEVERALKEMEGAAGSAESEMDIVRSSLDFKINALKQTWVGVLQDLIDRGTIGTLVDSLTKVSEALGWILDKLGLVKTAIAGIAGVWGAKNLG